MITEERKSNRVQADQFISFKAFDKEDRICEEGMALTRNISATGVLLERRTPSEPGDKFELQIALPDELIKANGIVRNVKNVDDTTYYVGIEFVNIADDDIQKIKQEFPDIE